MSQLKYLTVLMLVVIAVAQAQILIGNRGLINNGYGLRSNLVGLGKVGYGSPIGLGKVGYGSPLGLGYGGLNRGNVLLGGNRLVGLGGYNNLGLGRVLVQG